MLRCKITNKKDFDVALNWIRGSISIPKGCAAVLEYDPFTLMDRNSNVFFNAMSDIERGVVEVEYSATAPFKMVESIEDKPFEVAVPQNKEHKHVENKLFREQDPYHKNDFEANVAKNTKTAKNDPSDVDFIANMPNTGETAKEATEAVSEAPVDVTENVSEVPAEVATEAAPKTTRKKGGSKKL